MKLIEFDDLRSKCATKRQLGISVMRMRQLNKSERLNVENWYRGASLFASNSHAGRGRRRISAPPLRDREVRFQSSSHAFTYLTVATD
jgi:hypothetical protein